MANQIYQHAQPLNLSWPSECVLWSSA